jgi:hypothetical protein
MSSENLSWSDILSPTMTRDEYLAKFENKPVIRENFETYTPKDTVITEIKRFLNSKNESVKIFAIGAAWCKDCTVNIPRLIKIVDKLPSNKVELKLLYGIKVNPYRKPGEPTWSVQHSPPETFDPKFDVTKIPVIYFFNKSGEYLGRILENPKKFSTIEEVLLSLLK